MDNRLDAIQHLESAIRMIRDEQGSIQVVGRPLTPEEELRLKALEAAGEDIESAIGHLKGSGMGTRIDIPSDAR